MIGTDFDSLTGQYATQGPNLYVLARLHARPDLSVDQVLGEYYSAFGPAAAEVREYFDHWAAICDAVTEPPEGMHWSFFYREADKVFTPEAIATGEALLIRAMAAAAGDELAARRVAYFESGFTNAQMTLATQQAYRAYRAGNGVGGFRAAIGALDAHRAATEGELGANMCYLHWAEQRTWDRELLRLMENPGERIEDPWKFAWDPDTAGEDEGWWREEYDDAEWLAISTDGTWEEQVPGKQWRAETGRDYDGFAWYRRAFEIEADDTRPIVRLVFGAVDEACVVWLNDEKLLERPFPYQGNIESWQEAFEVDITDAARLGGTNSLAVRVEDNAGAGGIWRPVWIVRSPRAATEEANLLTNGDFENGDEGWGKSIMTGGFALEIDGAGHTGTNCARVECSALGSAEDEARLRQKAWGRWYQTGLKVTEGASYRLSLWAKTSKDFTGNLAIWVTGTEEGTMTGGMLDTEGMWREVTIEGIKPVGDEVGVYLNLMDGVGTAWFDGVELVEE